MVGTLHYLAPERLDGREADARSDIYAFGAILYEMLAGARAFDEPTQARLISAILTRDPAPPNVAPGVPSELTAIVMTLLCKDPDDRWQSIRDVAKMLRGVAARLGSPADGNGKDCLDRASLAAAVRRPGRQCPGGRPRIRL